MPEASWSTLGRVVTLARKVGHLPRDVCLGGSNDCAVGGVMLEILR